ncbi:helix-turn-helix domain-containing protein [Paenibacillus harenae]|uniref:helix-turn-helix domain-containing protein n=1 Tax=Paenibacillus harenae TaxID=306543 RepID=UPI00279393E5|nr:helix-turn-helix domain-containing protein [Paenibacillus harenae]MDQ0059731.1 cytoskeletal protein RodZ [Paenibacillus harenae]
MSDLGALLRKAREQRGLSLDDIQETTKIRKRYLEAIESGDHSILPGSFYVRAFVKNYSEAVGLDPDEVLRLYQHEVPAAQNEHAAEPIPVRAPRRLKSESSERMGKIGFNLMMWCFLILIFVVVWMFVINRDPDPADQLDQKTPITDASQPPTDNINAGNGTVTDNPVPTATPVPTQVPTTVTFASKVGKADKYDIGPEGTHKLEIKVSGGRSWLEIRAGGSTGEKLYSANADDGTIETHDLTQQLYVNVGRADLTEITVDGVPVPDGDRAGSKKLLINPIVSTSTPPNGEPTDTAADTDETGGTGNEPDSATSE